MDFKEKIDKILEIKKIKIWKLGDNAEMRTTLEKAYKDNREMTDRKTEEFLQKLKINRQWWDKGEGSVFQDISETSDHSNNKVPEEVYRNLVEANTEYRLVPKTILNEEYRIVLKSEIDSREKHLEKILELADKNIEAKDKLIEQLNREIDKLRSVQSGVHAKKA